MALQVHEIFSSINGEVSNHHQGSLCTFLRLQGCNLRCAYYCDTVKAQNIELAGTDGCVSKSMTISQIVTELKKQKNTHITITGGEPMLQSKELEKLIAILHKEWFKVSIETNGSILLSHKWPWNIVDWVIDYKLPYSGVCMDMKDENFTRLGDTDIVKFVVSSHSDFVFAERRVSLIKKECMGNIQTYPTFAFSPCKKKMPVESLYELMSKSDVLKEVGAVLSVQLHKIIGVS